MYKQTVEYTPLRDTIGAIIIAGGLCAILFLIAVMYVGMTR